ncbi:TetR/AcrR family transcriptional regulator C-terminal domain-containing protein [Dactylosporangium sp. CA-139066]|uniref:TetR/AcrR family transcriptional regulator C-terminal domain-containing protein n=1 Tax=Dactylosporangium sp. CA-139066 TaxID=3239930 RepID=UPI003D8C1891
MAFAIMQEEGLERVTMRRLANELDTGPASLYVYIRNTAELHGALLDQLLSGLELPAPVPAVRWRESLGELLESYTTLLLRYPSLARSVLTLRPSGGNYLRLIDIMLELLLSGGVRERQAAWGVDLLLQHATAIAAEQGTRGEEVDPEHGPQLQAVAVQMADPADYPYIGRVRHELFSGVGEQRMRWAFAAIIEGIGAIATPGRMTPEG